MKKLWLLIFILCFSVCHSQETIFDNNMYYGFLSDLYVNHLPDSKAAAMGGGLVANSDGNFGAYYNPALTSLSNGIKFNCSVASTGEKRDSRLVYYEASYTDKKFGSFGIGAYYINKTPPSSYGYNLIGKGTYYDAAYTINYSREFFKDFYAGVNLGIYHYSQYYVSWFDFDEVYYGDGVKLDIGLLKKFEIKNTSDKQIFEIGTAFYNVTNSKMSREFYDYIYKSPLPSIFRLGGSYQVKIKDGYSKDESYFVQFLTHIEFEKIVNSSFAPIYKFGEEITVKDIFSLRAGYFQYKYRNLYMSEDFEPKSELTVGVGLSLPFDKFFGLKNKLSLKVDYNLKEFSNLYPFELNSYDYSIGKYSTWAFSLNYTL